MTACFRTLTALTFVLCLVAAFPAQAREDWTLKRREGRKPRQEKVLKIAWSRGLKPGKPSKRYAPETTAPVIEDGVVYVGTHAGRFYAVNSDNGKILWTFNNRAPVAGAAAVGGGRVYFSDLAGRVNGLDAASGGLVWRRNFERELLGAPLLAGGRLYLIEGEQDILAIEQEDGRLAWRRKIPTFIKDMTMRGHADLVLDGDRLIAGLADGRLYALKSADGNLLWSRDLFAPLKTFKDIDAPVVPDGDSLYVGGYFARFYRLDRKTGAERWRSEVATATAPALVAGKIVVSDTSGKVVALDRGTGLQLWFNDLEGGVPSEPILFQGRLFVATLDRDAFLLDPESGEEVQKISIGAGSFNRPATDGRRIVVLTRGARLVSLVPRASN